VLGATAVTVALVAPTQDQALEYRTDREHEEAYAGILEGALAACLLESVASLRTRALKVSVVLGNVTVMVEVTMSVWMLVEVIVVKSDLVEVTTA
jgi:hypothetical protein